MTWGLTADGRRPEEFYARGTSVVKHSESFNSVLARHRFFDVYSSLEIAPVSQSFWLATMKRSEACLVVLLVIVCGRAASAQITSATISGTIKDQTGSVLAGVDIAIKNSGTGLTRS